MTLLTDVLDEARRGASPTRTALKLGVPRGLVDAALGHWQRVGVLAPAAAGGGCLGCAVGTETTTTTAAAPRSPACAACPLTRA